jgi:hypothetical protein
VPFAVQIEAGMLAGLTAQRIYQDLVRDHGFPAGYQSVNSASTGKRTGSR